MYTKKNTYSKWIIIHCDQPHEGDTMHPIFHANFDSIILTLIKELSCKTKCAAFCAYNTVRWTSVILDENMFERFNVQSGFPTWLSFIDG